jgi:hypothetical protein
MIGTYLIWPSRWNIPAHLSLGFCVTAYLVPGLATDVWGLFEERTKLLYMQINLVGAVALVVGLYAGNRTVLFKKLHRRFTQLYRSESAQNASMNRVQMIGIVAVMGMIVAYLIMGFVPMFAEDPFSAKQFKNEYFEPYYRAAYLFRGSFSLLLVAIPLLFTVWWIDRRTKPLLVALLAVLLITVSLARQSSAMGLITFIGFIAARSQRGSRWFLVLTAIVFPLGSAGYLLLGLLTGVESLTSIYSLDSVADIVASGAPDIYDQLTFLSGFQDVNSFTYGRTIFGGLVPGNYMWNPSVWSITYDNLGADISAMVTGGLRFSTALWGFCNFGWVGVVLIPFASGLINGTLIASLRRLPMNQSLMCSALVLTIYMTLGKQITEFFWLSIHNVPAILCALYVAFGMVRKNRMRSHLSTQHPLRP